MKPQTLLSQNQASYGTIVSKKLERLTNPSERPSLLQENDTTRDESRVYLNSPMMETKNQKKGVE